jgi:multisubunit Na+/H+ antiporter MnhB subunit
MWQLTQNFVCFERSMCSEAAIEPQRIGKMKNVTNAKIFPSRLAVTEGKTTTLAISTVFSSNMP